MTLQEMIDRNLLEEFDGASAEQINKRFLLGLRHFNAAYNLLNNNTDDRDSSHIDVQVFADRVGAEINKKYGQKKLI